MTDLDWLPDIAKDGSVVDLPPEPPDEYDVPPEYDDGEQDAAEAEGEISALELRIRALDAELLDTDSLSSIPRNEPLVDEFLYLNTTVRVNGASGAMKSFVMLDLAAHVATGLPWRGRKVKQGTVIYLVAEGAGGFEKRVRAWEQHYGIPIKNLLILPRAVQVNNMEWDALTEVCKRRSAALVICDTQARITVGVEENSAKEMGVIVHRVEEMRMATEACVALVHHQGVQGERGRGSTSVKGAMQTELRVVRDGKGLANTRITVISDKQKDDEEAEDVVFALEQQVIKGMAKEDGTPITSVVLVPAEATVATSEQAQQVRSEWKADTRVHAVLQAADGEPLGVTGIGDVLAAQPQGPLKRRTIQDSLKNLASEGAAEVAGMDGLAQLWRVTVRADGTAVSEYAQEAL